MFEFLIQIIIGLIIIVIGIISTKGNINLLHSYHQKHVKKEDIIPFGKTIGFGTIIIGITIVIAALITFLLNKSANIIVTVGFIIGLIIIFYSLFKYNKGVF